MRWWWLLLICACGRVGFDAMPDGAGQAVDAAPATCLAHAGALLCEDFEGDLGAWSTHGTTAIQTSIVHGGAAALASSTPGQPESAWVLRSIPSLSTATTVHVRAWLYAPSSVDVQHMNAVDLYNQPGAEGVTAHFFSNRLDFFIDTSTVTGYGGQPIGRDRWFCVEYALTIADSGGTVEMRVDDQIVIAENMIDTLPAGGFEHIVTGIPYSGAAQVNPATIYTDDVVVDVAPIGCAP